MISLNKIYFSMLFIFASSISLLLNVDWLFVSDFLTYRDITEVFSHTSLRDFATDNIFSVRPTEPLFSLLYWMFAPYSYFLLPSLALLFYLRFVFSHLTVTWLAIFALFLLIATTMFQAFHLQRQFLSIVFLLYAVSSTNKYYRFTLFTASILIHNSSALAFPLFLPTVVSVPLVALTMLAIFNLSSLSLKVGGDYNLSAPYYVILIFFSLFILLSRRLTIGIRRKLLIFLLLQFFLLLSSPYIGSRMYFSTFFVIIIPLCLTDLHRKAQL